MADTILIVDRDPDVAKALSKVIKSSQFNADVAKTGKDALSLISSREYVMLLLELELDDMDGFQVIRTLRSRGAKLPIVIVSSRSDDADVLQGLSVGADDYIVKPFNPVTLGAKIKALIRRSQKLPADSDNILSAGPFVYHTSTLRLYKNDTEIILTSKENALMKLFLDNVNHVFTRQALYEMVWNTEGDGSNTIMVYINRLRQKIEQDPCVPQYIQTVRGVGYRFVV